MHAAAARYVSVSELYSTDEVELLLDEIRDLEPTSCRGEDIQLCSLSCASCVWAGAGLQVWALPAPGRVRLLQLGAVTSALLHLALLLLRVTGLDALLPLRWDKLGLAVHGWSGGALLAGGAGSLLALLRPEYQAAPASLVALMAAAAATGLAAAAACLALVGAQLRACAAAARGRGRARERERERGSRSSAGSLRAAYRAVPAAPPAPAPAPAPAVASTSRQNPL